MKKGKKEHEHNEISGKVTNLQEEKELLSDDEGEVLSARDGEGDDSKNTQKKNGDSELDSLINQLDEKSKKCDEYLDMLQRATAEFDNYRKRTVKEKEILYADAVSDVVTAFLPVVDSIGKAVEACSKESSEQSLKEGIDLVKKQIDSVIDKLGVEEIKGVGEKFNPELHNAVMHVEDESCDSNTVVEEFQKGYIFKGKVIRHSMVKVAN